MPQLRLRLQLQTIAAITIIVTMQLQLAMTTITAMTIIVTMQLRLAMTTIATMTIIVTIVAYPAFITSHRKYFLDLLFCFLEICVRLPRTHLSLSDV